MIKNEEYLKRLNNIKIVKQVNERERVEEVRKREEEVMRRRRYLQDLQNQYQQRQKAIEDEINRKKAEQLELVQRNKQEEEIKKYMLEKMKKKYSEILEYNKYVLLFNDEFNVWRNSRRENSNARYELFSIMFDYDHIEHAYSDYLGNRKNYHYKDEELILDSISLQEISKDNDTQSIVNISLYDKLENLNFEEQHSMISALPSLYIKNYIFNDIINPLVTAAIEQASREKVLHKYPVIPDNSGISSDVYETINQIQAILIERNKREDVQIEIPISILIEELYYDIIIKQYKIVNTSFVSMLKHRYRISVVFEFLHSVLLSANCDIINNLVEHFIDFNTLSLISNEEEFLNDHFVAEINKKFISANSDFVIVSKSIRFMKTNKFNLKVAISNIDNAFGLQLQFPQPIDFVINNKVSENYDHIFKFIFKLTALHSVVTKVYSVCKNTKTAHIDKTLAKVFKTLFQGYRFLNSYSTFFFFQLIDSNYKTFTMRLNSSVDIYEIIESHNECLNSIIQVMGSKICKDFEKIYLNFAKLYLKVK
jgi:hypothetical protein